MGKVKGRPSWFKMFDHQKALIDSVSDEVAGKALKAAFAYFENPETIPCLDDPMTFSVFSTIKPYIDESYNDYQRSVTEGKAGAAKRWKNSPPIAPL